MVTTETRPETEFEVPAEDASLADLRAVSEDHREKLSDAQRARIDEAESFAREQVTTETTQLRQEHATQDAAAKTAADQRAQTQSDIDYHETWRSKLHSTDEDDQSAYRAEMSNADNEKRYLEGGAATRDTVTAEQRRGIEEAAILTQYQGWHESMKQHGLGDLFPATTDAEGWAKLQAAEGGAPKHIYDKGYEAGHTAGKEEGRSEAVAELGRGGRPAMSAGTEVKLNPKDIDLRQPGAGRELARQAMRSTS